MTTEPEISVNVLVDAKKEYTKKLVNLLTVPIYQGIQSIYDQARQASDEAGHQNYLRTFQILLRDIPKWNQDVIDTEHNRIILETKCNWLHNLIKAVFISHVKVLSAVRMGSGIKQIKLNIPSSSKFVHTCYVEAAKTFYKNPFLFYHDVQDVNIHKNMVDAIELIKRAVYDAIERLIPFQQIIYEYVEERPTAEKQPEEKQPEEEQPDEKNDDNEKDADEKNDDNKTTDEEETEVISGEISDIDSEEDEEDDDEFEDITKEDDEELEKSFEHFDERQQKPEVPVAGKHAKVDIPDEQRKQVKSIMVPKLTGAQEPAEQKVIYRRRNIKPENVGNVDLSSYEDKIAEDGALFFSDAEDE